MKYFGIIDKNVATIFQLQWKIGNISEMFLQYSVLCGRFIENLKNLVGLIFQESISLHLHNWSSSLPQLITKVPIFTDYKIVFVWIYDNFRDSTRSLYYPAGVRQSLSLDIIDHVCTSSFVRKHSRYGYGFACSRPWPLTSRTRKNRRAPSSIR